MRPKINLSESITRWPMKIRLKRGVWTYILEPLVRWLPKSASPVRIFALQLMGASIGKRCLILPGVKVLMPWNLRLSHHVALGEGVNIYNFALVSIGSMTVISQNSYLCTGSHDYRLRDMPLIYSPVNIGDECWIAAGVFIAPGVCLGNGSVIGARSVVTKDMPEWTVCAGHPCKPIKPRALKNL